jgi:hypothetical protein
MAKDPNTWRSSSTPTNSHVRSKYMQPSTMPIIRPLEGKSTIKPGSVSRAPTPTVLGAGVKRKP